MAYTTIDNPAEYFNTVLYAGSSSTQSITGVGFKPDWVWIKNRTLVVDNVLQDAVRGANKFIVSNSTQAELTRTYFQSFNADGFTLEGAVSDFSASGYNYVSWNWLGANTTVSNTAGTITSTVSANTTAGFSIVSYTATSGTSSIGHGLGVAPSMIILKTRDQAAGWITGLSVNGWDKYLTLNSTSANITDDRMFSPSAGTDPTSNLFWSNQAAIGSAGTMIAYCFAEVKGFSKFGSYTGNGSTNGPFVYTGFKPAFVMIKRTDSSTGGNWNIQDTARTPFNWTCNALFADSSSAEVTAELEATYGRDYLSNGFKLRASHVSHNGSGATYIYMAFASNPFVSSTGIPTTAR